jgi:hypothetical protein
MMTDATAKAVPTREASTEPDNEELEEMMTDAQIIGAALSRKPKEVIEPDSDATEEEEHSVIHIGSSSKDLSKSSTSSSSFLSSSSSSSLSDSSSQDTQELIKKLSSNPYLPLSNLKHKPKDLTKIDRSSSSKSDSASHQSSGQDLGSTLDHLPVDSFGNAPATLLTLLVLVIDPPRQSTRRYGALKGQRKNYCANPGSTSLSTWADRLQLPKPDLIFRYMFQNIQGLLVNPRGYKHQQTGAAFKATKADTFGMVELNLNFKQLGPALQWYERFKGLQR